MKEKYSPGDLAAYAAAKACSRLSGKQPQWEQEFLGPADLTNQRSEMFERLAGYAGRRPTAKSAGKRRLDNAFSKGSGNSSVEQEEREDFGASARSAPAVDERTLSGSTLAFLELLDDTAEEEANGNEADDVLAINGLDSIDNLVVNTSGTLKGLRHNPLKLQREHGICIYLSAEDPYGLQHFDIGDSGTRSHRSAVGAYANSSWKSATV